jgi:hypothetical protein
MFKREAFHIESGVVRVTNCPPRDRTIALFAIGVAVVVFCIVRRLVPLDGWLTVDEGQVAPEELWLLAGFLSLSAAFWWSDVTIDADADQVLVVRRWGLFRSRYRRPLSSFDALVLSEDDDGEVTVRLHARREEWLEVNFDKAIIWGRGLEETRDVAGRIAEQLHLPLNVYPNAVRRK